jgi:hypothetical protein
MRLAKKNTQPVVALAGCGVADLEQQARKYIIYDFY